MKLTDVSVRNAKPGASRREIPDSLSRGLHLIIQPSGRRSFAVRYRYNGATRKLTLQPGISLASARKAAAAAMHEVSEGRDPAAAKRQAKAKAASAARDTLRGVCTEYFQSRQARDLRTADERERVINVYVYPRLASRPIDTITRRDLIDLLDHIEDNHGQRTADVVLSVLRRIFGWHALRSETFNSPIIAGMGRYSYAQHARHRTLSDDELRKVWHAAGEFPVYGALIKFLLLSAARRAEAAEMTESELDAEGTWELPAVRSKTGEPIVRPLSQAARDVLAGVPRIADCPFYFSLDGQRPFGTFSHWKRRFDAKCGVANWTVHDLRRVSRSLLSRAGVNADHAERVLGHRIGGVRSTYDRHEFFEEKKFALEALAAQIERIVNPVDNVRALRG